MMKWFMPLVAVFALIGAGAAQAAAATEEGSQAQKPAQSSEIKNPSTTGQSREQTTQGAEAQKPSSETMGPSTTDQSRDQESRADPLNQLLENELSSVETYQQALDKFRPEGDHETLGTYRQLKAIHQDHQDAVSKLKTQVQQAGGTPTEDSGAWGAWAKIIMGSAKLLGDKTALGALKQGEESGVKDYQEALGEETVPSEAKSLIQITLLPRQQAHVAELDGLIQAVDKLEETAEKAEQEAEEASQ
ncbi:MAG: DUF2383 domain-containing protein [Gammaproteobacteria bacterium]